jgi:ABC-type sugar transport system ATPase subunit
MSPSPTDAIVLSGISKRFGSTRALESVDFSVRAGEVHGLVGLNGSGKSTLLKVLSGYITPAAGATCHLWGSGTALPIRFPWRRGIAFVPQTLALNRSLTVLDNVNVAGAMRGNSSGGWRVSRRKEAQLLREIFDDLGWSLDPYAEVRHLTPGEQAIVAITRAFTSTRLEDGDGRSSGSSCVVLDEPTAYLTQADTGRLLHAIGRLVSQGDSAILVSHRLDDIFSACQRVTVLREGRAVAVKEVAGTSKEQLVSLMTGREGRELPGAAEPTRRPAQPPTEATRHGNGHRLAPSPANEASATESLVLRRLSSGRLRSLDLPVPRGVIVGCTGLVGSGIDELTYAVMGSRRRGGEVLLDGRVIAGNPGAARKAGLAAVPADRGGQALWLGGSLTDNVGAVQDAVRWGGLYVSRKRMRGNVSGVLAEYGVIARGPDDRAAELSGGNQQKLVIARALATPGLKALVLHEPTSGVDVSARAAIYAMIRARVAAGLAVLVCSTDIEEIVEISDQIVVLVNGNAAEKFTRSEASVDIVALACS